MFLGLRKKKALSFTSGTFLNSCEGNSFRYAYCTLSDQHTDQVQHLSATGNNDVKHIQTESKLYHRYVNNVECLSETEGGFV